LAVIGLLLLTLRILRSPAVPSLLLAACLSSVGEAAPEVPLKLPSGKSLTVEVMISDADRQRGLMFRESLAQDRGLLFVFESAGHYPFWMKNCKFPIDILWLDENARVVYVAENVPPCRKDPCPNYGPSPPARPAVYVLEINAGQSKREKIVRGSKLDFKLLR
jgi:uncharacterized membrane protein (UPF0127 family)